MKLSHQNEFIIFYTKNASWVYYVNYESMTDTWDLGES